MSFLPKLWQDVYDRAQADTGSGGLFAASANLVTSFTNTAARPAREAAFPYVTFNAGAATVSDAFTTGGRIAAVRFNVWHEAFPGDGSDALARCAAIMARIDGDWLAQPTTGPTFGFDRWKPGLSGSGWEASVMTYEQTFEAHEQGVYHFIQEFRVLISKVRATA